MRSTASVRSSRLLNEVRVEGVLEVFDLIPHENSLVLVAEDIGGDSLSFHLRNGPFELSTFYSLAPKIVSSLAAISRGQVSCTAI